MRLQRQAANGSRDCAVDELPERVADTLFVSDVQPSPARSALMDVLLRCTENAGHRCAVRVMVVGCFGSYGANHCVGDSFGVFDCERRSKGRSDSIEDLADGCRHVTSLPERQLNQLTNSVALSDFEVLEQAIADDLLECSTTRRKLSTMKTAVSFASHCTRVCRLGWPLSSQPERGYVHNMAQTFDTDEVAITDEELTALALAADPDAPLDDGAVPLSSLLMEYPDLLPDWYMPAPGGFTRSRRRAAVVVLIIVALVAVNAVGLCVTWGHLEIAL